MQNFTKLLIGLIFLGLGITSCQNDEIANEAITSDQLLVTPQSNEGDIVPNEYIIMFDNQVVKPALSYLPTDQDLSRDKKAKMMNEQGRYIEDQIRGLLQDMDIAEDDIHQVYTGMVAGAAVTLNEIQLSAVQKHPAVAQLEHDSYVQLPPFTVNSIISEQKSQFTPCGVTRAGGRLNAGQNRFIFIIDTGIDLDHPDLNVATSFGWTIFSNTTPDDWNGHGTHVAGTAAARDNNFGVVGIAAGAPVVPIKVFNASGSAQVSWVIAGLNQAGISGLPDDVVNASLTGLYGSNCSSGSPYRGVILALSNYGMRVVIAAGNAASNANTYQPGCINASNVLTVAAMDCDQTFADAYSNFNMNPIDFIAVGTDVVSTYPGGQYAILSGTSMATPIVAGICQLRRARPRGVGNVQFGGESYPIAKRK